MRRLVVDPNAPDPGALNEAAAAIAAGGVVAFPTDTLYGLAADPFDAAAVDRVFEAKARPAERGLPLVAADVAQVERALAPLSPLAARLAARCWPGPVTLLVPAPDALAPAVTAGTGKVAVRVPAHAVARALCAVCGRPLVATSANLSGQPATADPDEVAAALAGRVDLLIDSGRTPGGAPSTIVDVTVDPPALVRAGAVPWDDIQRWLARG